MFITSIKKQSSFNYINNNGLKIKSNYFIFIYLKNFSKENHLLNLKNSLACKKQNQKIIMLGMKVTKKIGNAVVRNKIKRRIRHLIRLECINAPGCAQALVIIPRSGFEKIKFSLIQNELRNIINYKIL